MGSGAGFGTIDGINLAFDVALVRLDKEAARDWDGVSLSAVRDVLTPPGVLATGVGFGETSSGSRNSGVLLINGYLEGADTFGGSIPNAFIEVVPGDARNQMICPGDSGGPLFFKGWIAGVASFRFVATCPEEGPGYYVSLEHFAGWIRATLRELDPPGACRGNDGPDFATRDGGCKDLATGMVWSRVAPTRLSQPNAVTYCYGLEEAGLGDWRLPTEAELRALDANGGASQVELTHRAWSATDGTLHPDRDPAVLFNVKSHHSAEAAKSQQAGVVCVRGAAGP